MKFKEVTNENVILKTSGFEFDWIRRSTPDAIVVCDFEENRVAGLVEYERLLKERFDFLHLIEVHPDFRGTNIAGELLAYVGQDALNAGFEGFFVLESKSLLYEYYIEKYGAKPAGGRRLYFDTEATNRLIDKYLIKGDCDE